MIIVKEPFIVSGDRDNLKVVMILESNVESFEDAKRLLGIPKDADVVKLREVKGGNTKLLPWKVCLEWQGRRWFVGDEVHAADALTLLEGRDQL